MRFISNSEQFSKCSITGSAAEGGEMMVTAVRTPSPHLACSVCLTTATAITLLEEDPSLLTLTPTGSLLLRPDQNTGSDIGTRKRDTHSQSL